MRLDHDIYWFIIVVFHSYQEWCTLGDSPKSFPRLFLLSHSPKSFPDLVPFHAIRVHSIPRSIPRFILRSSFPVQKEIDIVKAGPGQMVNVPFHCVSKETISVLAFSSAYLQRPLNIHRSISFDRLLFFSTSLKKCCLFL